MPRDEPPPPELPDKSGPDNESAAYLRDLVEDEEDKDIDEGEQGDRRR